MNADPLPRHWTMTIPATLAGLGRVQEAFAEWGRRLGLGNETLREWRLVIEEIVGNVARYGYADGREGDCVLTAMTDFERITLIVEDAGCPFNPLAQEDPDLTAELSERSVGGLGIFLVRQFCPILNYERTAKGNRLTIQRDFSPRSTSPSAPT